MARASVETIENKGGKKHLFPPDKFSGLRLTLASIVGLASVTGVFLSIKSIQERLNNPATVPSRNDSVLVPPSFSPTIDSNGIITRVASITETPTPVATPTPAETVEPIKTVLSEQERDVIRTRIIELQKSLGIDKKLMLKDIVFTSTDPMYSASLAQRKEWGGTNEGFQNKLPDSLKPLGEVAKFIADQAFGDNSGRLVKGVLLGDYGQMAVNYRTNREIIFYAGIASTEPDQIVLQLLHEILGHEADPESVNASSIYPNDIFLQLQLSQWRILSQVASIDGAFINDQSDIFAQELAIGVGEVIGQAILAGKVAPNSQDAQQITQLLEDSFKSIDNKQRILSSLVAEEFGRQLLRKITANEIHLPEELQEDYNKVWSNQDPLNPRAEMFAEMVSRIIAKPRSSPELFNECERMISLISGKKVDLKTLTAQAILMTEDAIAKAKTTSSQSAVEVQKFQRMEENFRCFTSSEACGIVGHGFLDIQTSSLPQEVLDKLKRFRDNLLKIYDLYPELRDSNLHRGPNSSPSNLTSEHKTQLLKVADSSFIRRILKKLNSGQPLTDIDLLYLEARAKAMEGFLPAATPKQ